VTVLTPGPSSTSVLTSIAVLRGAAVTFERERRSDDGQVVATLLVHYLPDAVAGEFGASMSGS